MGLEKNSINGNAILTDKKTVMATVTTMVRRWVG